MNVELHETKCGCIVFQPKRNGPWVFLEPAPDSPLEYQRGKAIPEGVEVKSRSFGSHPICKHCFATIYPNKEICNDCDKKKKKHK